MDIKIEPIAIEQKSVLVQLMELYNYDFSEYEDTDINEYGYYGYPYIDQYWNEKGRLPYFIRVDGKLAGFVLVGDVVKNIYSDGNRNIAEFFIMKKYRRKGIGKYVAKKIFDMHKALWQVEQLRSNIRAQKFWKSVISEYTKGNFEETADEEWVGFLFDNSHIEE